MENLNPSLNSQSSVGDIINNAFNSWKGTLLYGLMYTIIFVVIAGVLSVILLPFSANSDYYIALFELLKNNQMDGFENLPPQKTFDATLSIGSALQNALLAPLSAGYLYIIKKYNNNESFDFSNLFDVYKTDFLRLFLYSLLIGILAGIGTVFCILPGIYIKLISFLAFPLLVFGDGKIWDTIKLAYTKTNSEFGTCLGVAIIAVLISLSGILLCGVGLFITLPFTISASYSIYLAMTNTFDWNK